MVTVEMACKCNQRVAIEVLSRRRAAAAAAAGGGGAAS